MYCHVLGVCEYRRGMDFILDLLTQLGTTSNDSATVDFHNLQYTTAPANPFPALIIKKITQFRPVWLLKHLLFHILVPFSSLLC
jgi:hypothetical protein